MRCPAGGKLADHRHDRQIQREDVVAGPQQGVEVGPAAGPLAKQVVELAAGNPAAFVVELQFPSVEDLADRGRIDSARRPSAGTSARC